MKKAELMTTVSSSFNKMGFKLKKHSPEILVVAGVVGTVVSAVMACKATTKVSDILEKTKEDINSIHNCAANESLAEEYTPEDVKKDLAIVYVQTGVKIAKLYAPAIALGALSLGSILASNNILRQRNVALAAAYATVDKGFKEYRNRVVERFGEEVERELRHNIKAKKIEKIVVGEDGKEKKVKETIQVAEDPNTYSDYARFFDDGCTGWEKDSEYNLMFLRAQQQYANDKLRATGRLFLNEVYDMLGVPRTKAGQVVGWVYDAENPIGDNYVDFGIYDVHRETVRNFVNGYERTILLDFNVDGNIWDLM
ncbi:MAG: DUF6353 family protein [Fermentimonas sp.]|nr:DUF6353 family protein [Fermentimonas sp.]